MVESKKPTLYYLLPIAVLLFAFFHLAANEVDVDLWGHTIFGQRMIELGGVERTEPFSWTAPGHRWINHELAAEVALGAAHKLAGGTGIWLLKTGIGLLVFCLCMGCALRDRSWPNSAVIWIVGAFGVIELAFGFAARPQMFTALGLILLLMILRAGHRGSPAWFALLPVLLVAWINSHGGALAGVVFVTVSAIASLAESQMRSRLKLDGEPPVPMRTALVLLAVVPFCFLALLVNPYGKDLPLWLWESVQYVRPEIDEWNPVGLTLDHLPFLMFVPVTLGALWIARRKVRWFEGALLCALMIVALRHVRHVPLFAIAAMAFLPAYLVEVGAVMQARLSTIAESMAQPRMQRLFAVLLSGIILALIPSTMFLRKERFYTMEMPRQSWPLDAIEFVRANELHGNTFTFFDWGELTMWELPKNPPSIDGRLDTCYPRALIVAHWDFYNERPYDAAVLDISKADVAIIPQDLACVRTFFAMPDWKPVYRDNLAAVFVRDAARFPRLSQLATLPVVHGDIPKPELVPFPNAMSGNATPAVPR